MNLKLHPSHSYKQLPFSRIPQNLPVHEEKKTTTQHLSTVTLERFKAIQAVGELKKVYNHTEICPALST